MQTPLSFDEILQHPQFQTTVEALTEKAHGALPLANGRIEKAVEIVLSGGVTLHPDGHAVVASQRRPHTSYGVNGCSDNHGEISAPPLQKERDHDHSLG